MTEHTPTPWTLHGRWLIGPSGPLALASGYHDYVTAPGGPMHEEWLANAALIVKAVNNHEALVGALERCERLFNEALPKFDWGKSALDANAIALLNEVPGEARTALAKVRS